MQCQQFPSMEVKAYHVRELPDGPGIRLPMGSKGKYRVIVNETNGIITLVPNAIYGKPAITKIEDLFED
jgi:hypothetical protein